MLSSAHQPYYAYRGNLGAGLFVVGFRPMRQWLGYPKLLIVGVDVDDVLGEQIPALLTRIQNHKGIAMGLSKGDISEWAFTFDNTDIAFEMEEALLDSDFVKTMPTMAGAAHALAHLYNDAHLVIATSRPASSDSATESWLKKHFRFHELVNTRETGKAVLGLEILIDLDNLRAFVDSGGLGIIFDQPWNQVAESDTTFQQLFKDKRIVRCKSWHDISITLDNFRVKGKFEDTNRSSATANIPTASKTYSTVS